MSSDIIDGLFNGCIFDLCALEGKGSQNTFRCNIYATLVSTCNDYALAKNIQINLASWRDKTNCRNFY